MTSATYRVTGMTCEHCVRAVSGELRALDDVSDVAIDLVPGGASVVMVTRDGPLPRQAVADALDEADDYQLAGTEQAAWRSCRVARSSLRPSVVPGPFGLEIFFPNGPGCT